MNLPKPVEVMESVTMVVPGYSRSKIAEMMIQGTTMGIVKTIRHLRDYKGDDREARGLGERLLQIQESNVEKMKAYL